MGLRKVSAIALVTLLAAQLGFAAAGVAAPATAVLVLSGQQAQESASLIHNISSHNGKASKNKMTHSHRHRHCHYHSHTHHEHHHAE